MSQVARRSPAIPFLCTVLLCPLFVFTHKAPHSARLLTCSCMRRPCSPTTGEPRCSAC